MQGYTIESFLSNSCGKTRTVLKIALFPSVPISLARIQCTEYENNYIITNIGTLNDQFWSNDIINNTLSEFKGAKRRVLQKGKAACKKGKKGKKAEARFSFLPFCATLARTKKSGCALW